MLIFRCFGFRSCQCNKQLAHIEIQGNGLLACSNIFLHTHRSNGVFVFEHFAEQEFRSIWDCYLRSTRESGSSNSTNKELLYFYHSVNFGGSSLFQIPSHIFNSLAVNIEFIENRARNTTNTRRVVENVCACCII